MLQEFIAPALSFGISATVIPGPLIAYLVNTTLTQGWRKALLILLAPLLTDAPIILLMTFFLGQMPAEILKLIQLSGGCLLLYIAWGALKHYQSGNLITLASTTPESNNQQNPRQILLTAILMNLLSPGPWLFWATVNGPLLLQALQFSTAHALAFLLAFYGTLLAGFSGWILLFHHLRRVRIEYLRYIILATVLLLLWFGIGLITAALGIADFHAIFVLAIMLALILRQLLATR